MRSDVALLAAAIEASGLSVSAFARDVLGVEVRTLQRWREASRSLDKSPTVRVVCRAIVDDPGLAARFAAITSELRAETTGSEVSAGVP